MSQPDSQPRRYASAKLWRSFTDGLFTTFLAVTFLLSGASERLARALPGAWGWVALEYALIVVAGLAALGVPFSLWSRRIE
ncbi:MAG: hypothetical protein ACRD1E_07480, partial [Terriglobales bacterium]